MAAQNSNYSLQKHLEWSKITKTMASSAHG